MDKIEQSLGFNAFESYRVKRDMYDRPGQQQQRRRNLRRLNTPNFEYNNPNDTYVISNNVKRGEALTSDDFEPTEMYFDRALFQPIFLTALGIVALVLLILGLCCRCCCTCLQCLPNDHHTESGHQNDSHAKRVAYIKSQEREITVIEITLIVLVLISDCFCYYGYGYLMKGNNDLIDALGDLETTFGDVVSHTNSIYTIDAPAMVTASNGGYTSGCSDAKEIFGGDDGTGGLVAFSDTYLNLAKTLDGLADTMYDMLETANKEVSDNMADLIEIFVLLIFCLGFICCVLFALMKVCHTTCGTKLAMVWAMITFLLLLIFNMPMMYMSQVFGDFCMKPTFNAVWSIPAGSTRDMVKYYATCQGTDTLGEALGKASTGMNDIKNATDTITSTFASCSADTYASDLGSACTLSGDRLDAIGLLLSCPTFQRVWFKLINDAFCQGFFDGIYSIWVSQFLTSFFLYFLIIVASISYQFFKDIDTIVPDDDYKDQDKYMDARREDHHHHHAKDEEQFIEKRVDYDYNQEASSGGGYDEGIELGGSGGNYGVTESERYERDREEGFSFNGDIDEADIADTDML
jgi:hypothetical protein